MRNPISRRRILGLSAGMPLAWAALTVPGAARVSAVEAFQRGGPARLRLGLAAYSFRNYFKDLDHDREKATPESERIDMFQFIDYCARHGCDGAEVTSYYFPKDFARDYLLRLKRHAFLRGVALSGTAVGNTFTHPAGEKRNKEIAHVKQWIDHAAVLGAPHVRVFAGSVEGTSRDEAKRLCIEALEECGAHAAEKGIFLGIENHGGIVAEADDLLEIVQAVKCPWVGINLDTGNFHTADPYADLVKCAPHAVNVQLKTELRAKGKPSEASDLPRLIKILRDANFQGYVTLEYEAAEDPNSAVPRVLGRLRELIRA